MGDVIQFPEGNILQKREEVDGWLLECGCGCAVFLVCSEGIFCGTCEEKVAGAQEFDLAQEVDLLDDDFEEYEDW